MTDLQYSANISEGFLFNEAGSLPDRYRAAKKAGFQAVECPVYSHPLEELVEVLEETGLKQALINSCGTALSPETDAEFETEFRRSITAAKALGCSNIHFLAGLVPVGKKRCEVYPIYLRRLHWAAKECLPRHVNVLIEPISAFVNEAYFLNNFGMAVDVLAELECRNIKIQLDVFHFQQIHPKYDVVKWARVNQKAIGHLQIAQSPKRNEPHASGDIDYARILPELDALFPDLYCGLEYRPADTTLVGLECGKRMGPVFDYAV